MELLAPAGGMEQLRAAVRFGADAAFGLVADRAYDANASSVFRYSFAFSGKEVAVACEKCG